jgi:hypothetical protein
MFKKLLPNTLTLLQISFAGKVQRTEGNLLYENEVLIVLVVVIVAAAVLVIIVVVTIIVTTTN